MERNVSAAELNDAGVRLATAGNIAEAKQKWRAASEMDPTWSVPHFNLAKACVGAGDDAAAIAYLTEAERLAQPSAKREDADVFRQVLILKRTVRMRAETVDLRPVDTRGREERAQRPLRPVDEAIAQELSALSSQCDRLTYGTDAYRAVGKVIRDIGEKLCANGGEERMELLYYRVHFVHGHARNLGYNWSGICGWQD